MYEETFKSIDNFLWKDAGCDSELDYIEQTSWILFLKYLDDYENDKETAALLNGVDYKRIIDNKYRWNNWAYPVKEDGSLNIDELKTGSDLVNFVNQILFPYLRKFKDNDIDPKTIKYKIGEIFSEVRNRIESGYTIRSVIDKVNTLTFLKNDEKFELSNLYEDKIKNMGNAGRTGGQHYTPRPLIRSIVKVIKPSIGETIYDGACGSCGFFCEAYTFMLNSKELSASEFVKLQKETFFGKEKKSLGYIIGIMNMILHGIESPNIIHTNTLTENLANIQQKDRFDIILANPPFGGSERNTIQQNFPIKSSETAYLFLQHFLKILKAGGRSGIVIKNTFLSSTDNASIQLRKQLLTESNLYAILDLPKVFGKTGVETVVLFFEKGSVTEEIFYYQLNPGRNIGLTNPLNDEDLKEFNEYIFTRKESKNSWLLNIDQINSETWDLKVENPNTVEEIDTRTPNEIISEIEDIDREAKEALYQIKGLI